jgi:hypothetical protein
MLLTFDLATRGFYDLPYSIDVSKASQALNAKHLPDDAGEV